MIFHLLIKTPLSQAACPPIAEMLCAFCRPKAIRTLYMYANWLCFICALCERTTHPPWEKNLLTNNTNCPIEATSQTMRLPARDRNLIPRPFLTLKSIKEYRLTAAVCVRMNTFDNEWTSWLAQQTTYCHKVSYALSATRLSIERRTENERHTCREIGERGIYERFT